MRGGEPVEGAGHRLDDRELDAGGRARLATGRRSLREGDPNRDPAESITRHRLVREHPFLATDDGGDGARRAPGGRARAPRGVSAQREGAVRVRPAADLVCHPSDLPALDTGESEGPDPDEAPRAEGGLPGVDTKGEQLDEGPFVVERGAAPGFVGADAGALDQGADGKVGIEPPQRGLLDVVQYRSAPG